MCPLDRLHIQIQNAIVGADSGVAGVCQRAGLAIAETGNLDGINKRKFGKAKEEEGERTLYSFLQKFWPLVVLWARNCVSNIDKSDWRKKRPHFNLKAQNC